MKTISATDASRHFAQILDQVRHHGESFVVVRRGEAIARVEPASAPATNMTLVDLLRITAERETGDPGFAGDLEAIQRDQPAAGDEPWAS